MVSLTALAHVGEAMLRTEFEKLLQILRPESVMDKGDLQQLKDKVFGPQTFFVTETRLTDDFAVDAGWLVRSKASLWHATVVESSHSMHPRKVQKSTFSSGLF